MTAVLVSRRGTLHYRAFTLLYSADTWGITHDGTDWWTTEGDSGLTVSQRDSSGTETSSFEADLSDGVNSRVRGIAYDGTHLWLAGAADKLVQYSTAGVKQTEFPIAGSGHQGVAWDGTHVWVVDGGSSNAYEYTTGGTNNSSFSLGSGTFRGVTYHDSDLWFIEASGRELHRYTTAGTLVSVYDIDGGPTPMTDVWINSAGTLHISGDGDGVYADGTV